MKKLEELFKLIDKNDTKIVAIAQAADLPVLQTVKMAIEQQLCQFVLIGQELQIQHIASDIDLNLENKAIQVVHADSREEAALLAVQSVRNQDAQVLMKGDIATSLLLKAVLHKEYGLRTGNILSHVALFEVPNRDKLIFLSDAAMNIAPNLEEKKQILINVVQVTKSLGIHAPKVAVLAAVEVVNPAMPATTDAAGLSQMQSEGQIVDCIVDGPLAFDVAVSKEAANQKNVQSEVAGQADVLIVPTIEVGNALYKSFIYFAAAKVAAIISGARAPIVLTSRSDTSESKLYSLALALLSSTKV